MTADLDRDYELLLSCESGSLKSSLRFWTPLSTFVVVGYGNVIHKEVNVGVCTQDSIPIYRRCSGGGTVLQAPGCLNYSLILSFEDFSDIASISSANSYIMNRMQGALSAVISDVSVQGITDLTYQGKKFSGNAQKRLRRSLLFHGTFLLEMDLSAVSRYLNHPSIEPDYRQSRPHHDFICNLFKDASIIKQAVCTAWPEVSLLVS